MRLNDITKQIPLIASWGSIREAIAVIDAFAKGIVLVVDERRRFFGTITDGDVRRAVLAKIDLDTPVEVLLERNADSPYPRPVTALLGVSREELLKIMKERGVRQIPILNESGCVADLVTFDELVPDEGLPMQAVIMAGGMGTRLYPLTENMPKPMLPVGGRPLMESIIDQLQKVGIRRVNVTACYKPEKIMDHFGDGGAFGVELNYVMEDQPLGTGGALGLMGAPTEPLLVINGDVLTQVNFRALYEYHKDHDAEMTVAVRHYEVKVPYGVVDCVGPRVKEVREKPSYGIFVNAGIYLLEPSVYEYIPGNGRHFNMTDLIQWLLNDGRTVVSFPVREYWLDIGRYADYVQAQEDFKGGRFGL